MAKQQITSEALMTRLLIHSEEVCLYQVKESPQLWGREETYGMGGRLGMHYRGLKKLVSH